MLATASIFNAWICFRTMFTILSTPVDFFIFSWRWRLGFPMDRSALARSLAFFWIFPISFFRRLWFAHIVRFGVTSTKNCLVRRRVGGFYPSLSSGSLENSRILAACGFLLPEACLSLRCSASWRGCNKHISVTRRFDFYEVSFARLKVFWYRDSLVLKASLH